MIQQPPHFLPGVKLAGGADGCFRSIGHLQTKKEYPLLHKSIKAVDPNIKKRPPM